MGNETRKGREKAVLVGVATRNVTPRQAREHLAELGRLADTAGANIVGEVMQRRQAFDPSTLIGEGKAKEVAALVEEHKADLVIFDEDLTGSQAKNLEALIKVKILDRSGLILDIFAKHARTAESRIQVEMAQLEYMLPRLTRAWTHLSRQAGGSIGLRGPGETQLETDRRAVRKRVADLRKKLDKLESLRTAQRERRRPTFHAALVGYTNAGKSTLMNALTHAGVEAADRLFATLDPTTRQLWLGGGVTKDRKAVISDTVGFIRKLPHGLVSSFKSTLSAAAQATFILHVVDASSSDFEEQMEITARILEELGITETPRLVVFNKCDLLEPERIEALRVQNPEAVFVSAEKKMGMDDLRERLRAACDMAAWEEGLAHAGPEQGIDGFSAG
ncbi:MAG TPA: GTPase HflX [Fibrobacteria bacterium]|nr:GTPase HflX [Fibrobacteria bacterium]